MTVAEAEPGRLGIAATCGSPKGFPGGGRCGGGEAAGTLPPRQDAGRVPFRAVAALAACGSSLPLASLHNVSLCKAGPAGFPAGRGRRGAM